MIPHDQKLLSVWLLVQSLVLGCKVASKAESLEANRRTEMNSSAFFAFDGTAITYEDQSTIVTMMEAANAQAFYYHGSNVEGSTLFADLHKALDQVCELAKRGNLKKVYVAGYSRGAISAIAFVHRAPKRCGMRIPFAWIGLLDPVNTNVTGEELPTYLPGGLETPCTLVHKENTWEHFVTTVKINGCNSAIIPVPDVNHKKMARDPRSREALMRSAQDLTNGSIGYEEYLKNAGPAENSLYKPKPLKSDKDKLCRTKSQDSAGCLELACEYDILNGLCFE